MKYPFAESPNTACITCCHIMDGTDCIRFVSHDDEDGMWQFLCGREHETEDARLVSLESIFEIDNSVGELADMPCGHQAERDTKSSIWNEMKEDMEIIKKEVGEIIDRLAVIYDEEDTDSPEIQSEIERLGVRLKELTGKTIEECEPFHAYWSYTSLDTVVNRILMPELEVNAPFTKEQIIEIVKRIQECKYSSEAESDKDLMLLEKGVLDPNISDYIFWDNLTPEEIADKALSYKPIQL